MKNISALLIGISILFSIGLFGQEPVVRAELCSDTIMVGHQFTLTYLVDGGQINSLKDNPNLEDFNMLSGPNMSSSMSFVNGHMSAKASINFVLQAITPGDYTIVPVTLLVDEKEFIVDSLKIVIIENPDGTTIQDLMPQNKAKKKSKEKRKTYKL